MQRRRLLEVVNIGKGAQPLRLLTVGIGQRQGAAQHPAVNTVRPADAVLDFIDLFALRRLFAVPANGHAVFRVQHTRPAVAQAFVQRQAGIGGPARVEVGVLTVGLHHPGDLRQGVGHLVKGVRRLGERGGALGRVFGRVSGFSGRLKPTQGREDEFFTGPAGHEQAECRQRQNQHD